MADSTLSITVRDAPNPCAPYQSTENSFRVQIYHCDGQPLFWQGVDYGTPVQLTVQGKRGGLIHGQFQVPPGCYLVRAFGRCENTVTHWAWVNVGCGETECVDLVLPGVFHCIQTTIAGLLVGTARGTAIRELLPREVDQAVEILNQISERLPRDPLPAPPSPEEIERLGDGGSSRKRRRG
jgi:hypothetical protein